MSRPVHLAASRTYPVAPERAFDRVLPAPLERVFSRRYAALPAIRGTQGDGTPWGTRVGQERTIALADGGTMRETLTSVERPGSFGYRIDAITGPMKLVGTALDGRWDFDPSGTGVRITWSWDLVPASRGAGLAMPLFTRLWGGYARQGLEELEAVLVV